MTVYIQDTDFTLYQGDALETLRELRDGSVDCCVTSPPYWGLRDYGTGEWEGGDEGCDHARPTTTYNKGFNERWGQGGGQLKQEKKAEGQYAQECANCGARRVDRQLGLEPTPDEFVANMVAVFREVRRVLAPHGTCWVNLGDSYAASGGDDRAGSSDGSVGRGDRPDQRRRAGLKPKDLVGIPWRVAFALQADGWYLRSDIIWAKPNPMPESVTDRPTKAHEYVFLLTRSPRYWFDQEAVREPGKDPEDDLRRVRGDMNGYARKHEQGGTQAFQTRNLDAVAGRIAAGRNIRSVWEIATQPYPEAHFATFPEELARRCIVAGCPVGGVVLDPFMGSGTVAHVARKHGRSCVGIELNPEYCELIARRTQQLSLIADQPG